MGESNKSFEVFWRENVFLVNSITLLKETKKVGKNHVFWRENCP